MSRENKYVYLDYAAATPLLPAVFAVMEPILQNEYGNAGSVHRVGLRAKGLVEAARDEVARSLEVRPEFVTFTSGGTEGNNLAIFGTVEALRQSGREYKDMEVITTRIEHPSISEAFAQLAELGVGVHYVAVNAEGKVALDDLRAKLSAKTVLVSVAYANSEIGTVQSVRSIKKTLHEVEQKFGTKIFFQVDAAQAPLWLSCRFDSVSADLLVLDAGKCGGPKGVGVLVRSRRAELKAVNFGGGQEQGLRSGTENVAGIVGAAKAFQLAQVDWQSRAERVSQVRDFGIELLLKNIPGAVLNGATGEARLANNINISLPGLDTEYATIWLDAKGFAVSTKSACAGAGGGESAVVREISADPARATSTLRISLGPDTTTAELEALTKALKTHIELMKAQ